MKGWKTWVGAALVAGSAGLHYYGQSQLADLTLSIGAAFGLVGIGHKIDKSSNTTKE